MPLLRATRHLLNKNLSFGLMASIDHAEEVIEGYSDVSGTGWMVGPYIAAELMPDVFFTGRIAYGRSSNSATIDIFNNGMPWSGDFDTERLLARFSLYGEASLGNLQITPAIDIAALRERQAGYSVSNGFDTVEVEGSTKTLGRLELSTELVLPTNLWPGNAEFYATPTLAWDFTRDFVAIGDDTLHGSLEIGLRSDSPDGWNSDIAVRVDGAGEPGFDGVSVRAGFSREF